MSVNYNPRTVTDGLVLALDAGNTKSYPGSGTTWTDLSGNAFSFSNTTYTYPSYSNGYFTFVNDGVTQNNIKGTPTISTRTNQYYTRIGWFYQTSQSLAWAPIIQNSIGNNSDMGLVTMGNKISLYQYTNSVSGNISQDSSYSSSVTFSDNTWVMGAITVDLVGKIVKFYTNGNYDSQSNLNTIGNSNSDTIVIGGADTDSYGGYRMFKGRIANVMHYNRVLTAAEISQNFNALRGRFGI